jgi:murein DD-endopeptidase MepM/ murein hydrolase activator NlpD
MLNSLGYFPRALVPINRDAFIMNTHFVHNTIGFDPPLDLNGADSNPARTETINLRWLTGTVLTAICGAFLMSVAIISTSEHRMLHVLDQPAIISDQKPIKDRNFINQPMRRSDKLVQSVDIASAKRSFRAPITIKVGDKEIIKTRSYTRIATSLVLAGVNDDEIPNFNPMQLISEANTNRGFDKLVVVNDINAQVTLQTHDLTHIDSIRFSRLSLTEETIITQVKDVAVQPIKVLAQSSPQNLLAKAMRIPIGVASPLALNPKIDNPFSRIEVKLIQENVSSIEKTILGNQRFITEDQITTIRKNEPLETALKGAGLANGQIQQVSQALSPLLKQHPLVEGDRLKLTLAGYDNAPNREVMRIALYGEAEIESILGRKDNGQFTPVPIVKQTDNKADEQTAEDEEGGLSVFKSIYETALKHGAPRFLIDELVRVYSYDVDFQRRVQGGDAIEFFYAEPEEGDKGRGELLFASITLGGEKKTFYRFLTTDDNSIDFYDGQGRSARKFLLRMPLPDGQLRSGFGYRRHPILGYSKMHTGTDWANKVGTPIFAAGNGTIIKSGWASGYGNHIEIEHLNGYITTYSHMSAYGRGTDVGARVRQGQIIGYLGSTGLSTGPHLHYEVIVNDNFVDPMAIKLPRGRELDGRQLAEFKRERERTEQLILKAQSKTNLAQTN